MKYKILIISISAFFFLFIFNVNAVEKKTVFPKIANYFLKWNISEQEAIELANWDLLILDMEVSFNSPDKIIKIRQLNPDVIILAYITSQEILENVNFFNATLRQKLFYSLDDSWWLKDTNGEKIEYWPQTKMLNVSDGSGLDKYGQRYNDFLPKFVVENIKSTGLFDGVFYDNTWGDVSWVNANIDIKNNGQNLGSNEIDNLWSSGFKKILDKTRNLAGDDFIIVGNGRVHPEYLPYLHGMMFENFPSYWESGGTWDGSINTYLNLPLGTRQPSFPVINSYNKNRENYQIFRFGLGSALLGEGYYSFDYDVTCHSQTWWYDEYEVYLGNAISAPYNLLENNNNLIKPGLWRRDFENGVVIVNSTEEKQRYIFKNEVLEKIRGTQDKPVNSGQRINWLEIEGKDAIILHKEMEIIYDSSFTNGQYIRTYNKDGEIIRGGFFSYLQSFPGSSQIILYDLLNDGQREQIVSYDGLVKVYKNGHEILSFRPFHPSFRGKISLAVADLNNNGQKEIITGAGPGGGPQVRVFNLKGECVSTFFAYDPNFRGGIDVTAGDTNNNGKYEIITGAGPGGGPHIRIFDYMGRELSTFFAYDPNFRGGVNVTSADLNNNGKYEIISGPGPNMKPEIKYFNERGQLIKSFLAFDESFQDGVSLSAYDLLGDSKAKIFVGIYDF
jgi:hypothetical protein